MKEEKISFLLANHQYKAGSLISCILRCGKEKMHLSSHHAHFSMWKSRKQARRSSSTKDKTTCRLTLSSMASQCPIHAFCKLFLNSEAWLQAQMHFFASDTSSFWQPASYGMYSISINSGLHSVWNIYLSMFFYCYCIVVVYQECWQCCIVKVTHKEKIHKLRGRVDCKKNMGTYMEMIGKHWSLD